MADTLHDLEIEELTEKISEVESSGKFEVNDESSASWCFRKIIAIKKQQERVHNTAQAEMKHIKEWQDKETEKLGKAISFFEGKVIEYLIRQRMEVDPDFKVNTPYGTATLKKQQALWEIENQADAIAWLKELDPELIRVTEAIDKAGIKKVLKASGNNAYHPETGEIAVGIKIVQRPDKPYIKVVDSDGK